jgi:hypothetical protein
MANRKISDLTALTTTATGDLLPIVDISEAGAVDQNKKITVENLFKGIPGNVGIGTSSPNQPLVVYGASGTAISVNNSTTGTGASSGFQLQTGSGTNAYLWNYSNGFTAFGTNNTERLRIDSSGRLLVGTSTASSANINNLKLEVSGNVKFGLSMTAGQTGADYDGIGYNVGWQASTGHKYTTGDTAAYIKFGANSGRIETFTAPSGVAGNAISFTTGPYVAQGGTSWTSSSDERLKEDLAPIEDALEKINALRAVTGRFKTDAPDKRRPFLLAQDVKEVLPEAVDETVPDSLGLDYSGLIPLLVAALKESKERIETLEARLTAAGIA